MGLPSYSRVSSAQFCVGFGPRGIGQRLILTQLRADRLADCDAQVVAEYDPGSEHIQKVALPIGSRSKNLFRIPWQLDSAENVEKATRRTLVYAHENVVRRIVFAPLGMGDDGVLAPDQSATAMLGAIYALWADEKIKIPSQILISIHADSTTYPAFKHALIRNFFPHRQAENPTSGLNLWSGFGRFGARKLRRVGDELANSLVQLSDGNDQGAAETILRIAKERPNIFKADDIRLMKDKDGIEAILETLFMLRSKGGKVGEAAREALISREKAEARKVIDGEMNKIAEADRTELFAEREAFLETMTLGLNRVDVDKMCSGTGPHDVRCNYSGLWGKLAMISLRDDDGHVRPQFIRFHHATGVTKSRTKNKLFSIGLRVADKKEAVQILTSIRGAVSKEHADKTHPALYEVDGSPWFLNMRAEYREDSRGQNFDWDSSDLPNNLGRGVLYMHFENHAESDWNSQILLRILSEDFGLTLLSPKDD